MNMHYTRVVRKLMLILMCLHLLVEVEKDSQKMAFFTRLDKPFNVWYCQCLIVCLNERVIMLKIVSNFSFSVLVPEK